MVSDIISNVIVTNKIAHIYWVFIMCQTILALYVLICLILSANYEEYIISIIIYEYS